MARVAGVYQPRSRRAAFSDAMDDARAVVTRVLMSAAMRGAGALLLLAALAALLALATFNPEDAGVNTATGNAATNLFGGVGATGADILLEWLGFASLAFLAPPAIWGARALFGRGLNNVGWRA